MKLLLLELYDTFYPLLLLDNMLANHLKTLFTHTSQDSTSSSSNDVFSLDTTTIKYKKELATNTIKAWVKDIGTANLQYRFDSEDPWIDITVDPPYEWFCRQNKQTTEEALVPGPLTKPLLIDDETYLVTILDGSGSMNAAIPIISQAVDDLRLLYRDAIYTTQEAADKYILPANSINSEKYLFWMATDYRELPTDKKKYLFLIFINESHPVYNSDTGSLATHEANTTWLNDFNNFINAFNDAERYNAVIFVPTSDPPVPHEVTFNDHLRKAIEGESNFTALKDYNVSGVYDWPINSTAQEVFDVVNSLVFGYDGTINDATNGYYLYPGTVVPPDYILETNFPYKAVIASGTTSDEVYIGPFLNETTTITITDTTTIFTDKRLFWIYDVYLASDTTFGGTRYLNTIDYTFNTTNKSITIVNDGRLNIGDEIYISYAVGNDVHGVDYVSFNSTVTNLDVGVFSGPVELRIALLNSDGFFVEFAADIRWESTVDTELGDGDSIFAVVDETGGLVRQTTTACPEVREIPTDVLKAEYLTFEDPIRVSTPMSALSDVPIGSSIFIDKYEVVSGVIEPTSERRHIEFNTANNTELYLHEQSLTDNIVRSRETHNLTVDLIPLDHIIEKKISFLPDTPGELFYAKGIDRVGLELDETSLALADYTSSAFIPSSESGWVASMSRKEDMRFLTPDCISWSLILSISSDDVPLVLSTLKELVRLAKQRQWLVKNEGRYEINTVNKSAAFEAFFGHLPISTSMLTKEVRTNAFLGYCACIGLSFLNDRLDVLEYTIRGSSNFADDLLLTLESLALFCSQSISSVTHWASYKQEVGIFTYDSPSLSASYAVDLFLSSFLCFRFNSSIYFTASKLRHNLMTASLIIDDPMYINFSERDYTNPCYSYDPSFIKADSPLQAEVTLNNKLLVYAYQALWLTQQLRYTDVTVTLAAYDTTRVALEATQSTAPYYNDHIILLAYQQLNKQTENDLSSFLTGLGLSTVEGFLYPSWSVATIDSAISVINSSRYYEHYYASADTSNAQLPDTVWLFQLAIAQATLENSLLLLPQSFSINYVKALATSTISLLEVKRMIPFGIRWFSPDTINNSSSVLGALLYSFAMMYYKVGLDFDILQSSLSPYTAKSDFARDWYSQIYNTEVYSSGGHIRNIFTIDKVSMLSLSKIEEYLLGRYDLSVEFVQPTIPQFSLLTSLTQLDEADSDYSDIGNNYSSSWTPLLFYTVIMKRSGGSWVERVVPGFPIKASDKPIDIPELTPEAYLTSPVSPCIVSDGTMFVYPLANYVMSQTLDIGLEHIPSNLSLMVSRLLPSSLVVEYLAQTDSKGEV